MMSEGKEITITDQGGNEVTFKTKPAKVVVAGIPPFTAFLIQFTGMPQSIVGAPGNSYAELDWTKRVYGGFESITSVGMGPNFEVENVLSMKPDLIFVSIHNEEAYKTFRESNIPTIGISNVAHANDVLENARAWYKMLGEIYEMPDKADAIIANIDRIKGMVEERSAKVTEKVNGLMMPYYTKETIEVSNNEFYGGYWLASVGANNVAAEVVGWESTMEEVLSWNPDVIFLSAFSPFKASEMIAGTAVEGHEWSKTKAGADNRIYRFPQGIFNWYALSPDASVAMLWIATLTYPELYQDVDMVQEMKQHYKLHGIELTDEEVQNLLKQE